MKIDMDAILAEKPSKVAKTKALSTAFRTKIPQPHGGALNGGGTPGNKGGTGRPPGSGFKQLFAQIRDDPKVHKAMRTAARNAKHPNFGLANKLAVEYDDQKPKQEPPKVEVQVGVIFLPTPDAGE